MVLCIEMALYGLKSSAGLLPDVTCAPFLFLAIPCVTSVSYQPAINTTMKQQFFRSTALAPMSLPGSTNVT